MVRHDDEFVQRHVRVLGFQPLPGIGHQSACIVQAHIAIHYLTEQTRPSLDNHGHKVSARLRIVESPQADRPASPTV